MPADSSKLFMSRITQERQQESDWSFRIRDRYPLGFCFPADSATTIIVNFPSINGTSSPYNPYASHDARCISSEFLVLSSEFLFLKTRNSLLSTSSSHSMWCVGLGLSRFARRYSGNSRIPVSMQINSHRDRDILLVSFPLGTEMFHFPRCTSRTRVRDICRRQIGFPIRTFSDQSLLVSSPKHFVDCYVLHRSTESRHPPHTLQTSTRKLENHITLRSFNLTNVSKIMLGVLFMMSFQWTGFWGNKKGRISRTAYGSRNCYL